MTSREVKEDRRTEYGDNAVAMVGCPVRCEGFGCVVGRTVDILRYAGALPYCAACLATNLTAPLLVWSGVEDLMKELILLRASSGLGGGSNDGQAAL